MSNGCHRLSIEWTLRVIISRVAGVVEWSRSGDRGGAAPRLRLGMVPSSTNFTSPFKLHLSYHRLFPPLYRPHNCAPTILSSKNLPTNEPVQTCGCWSIAIPEQAGATCAYLHRPIGQPVSEGFCWRNGGSDVNSENSRSMTSYSQREWHVSKGVKTGKQSPRACPNAFEFRGVVWLSQPEAMGAD